MARPRVLVTRSEQQAETLAAQLRAVGAEPILLPVMETVAPRSYEPLDDAICRLTTPRGAGTPPDFHWLIFTSVNGVQAFHNRLQLSNTTQLDTELKIAAIGPATVRALERIGLAASLVPLRAVAESLAEALLPYARQPDGSSTRFLLVRPESIGTTSPPREVLPEALRAAGADVTIVPAYRTVTAEGSVAALRELFFEPARYPDAITFTSSSSVRNLLALLDAAGVALPAGVALISIGPITSTTLRGAGLPPDAEALEASTEGLTLAWQVFNRGKQTA